MKLTVRIEAEGEKQGLAFDVDLPPKHVTIFKEGAKVATVVSEAIKRSQVEMGKGEEDAKP